MIGKIPRVYPLTQHTHSAFPGVIYIPLRNTQGYPLLHFLCGNKI